MKVHQLKTLAAFTSLAVALSSVAQPASALTVPEAITSIQSSNPTLPTGVPNPKGNIGFLLANMFWNSSDVGYDSTKFGKIKPTYFDGAGATAWTYAGGNTYMTDMNGRVGVGTNDPQAYLHLKSNLNDNSPALLLESPAAQYGSPRIALVDTSSWSVTARPAWMVDNSFDRFRVFRQPNLTTPGLAHLLINSSGSVSVGSQVDVFNAKASFEVRRGEADSEYAAWIEGMNSNNLGLGVNIANTSSSKGVANFKSGNVSRLFVRADGNVGIGTTAPESALDVNGDISGYTRFRYTSVNGDYFWLRSRIGTEPNALSIGIGSDETTGTTKDIRMLTNGIGRFFIGSDGKIGMGTFTPTATLDVVGEAKAVNGTFTDVTSQSTSTGALKLSGTNGAIVIDDGGNKRISWNDAGGNFNIRWGNYHNGTSVVYAKSPADSNGGAAAITLSTDGADGSVAISAAPIGVPGTAVSFPNYFYVTSTNSYFGGGNVGIGTSAPGAKLEVAGQIKITGGTPGAGKVLTSDATGLATWTSPASYAESDPKVATSSTGYLARWNGSQLVNSNVIDDGTNVGIGIWAPYIKLAIGDSDTGLDWESDGKLDVYSNNNIAMAVRNRNVGFGTTSPTARVHSESAGNLNNLTNSPNITDIAGYFGFSSTDGIGIDSNQIERIGAGNLNINYNSTSNLILNYGLGSGGNVGIGITNPTQKLEVAGVVAATGIHANPGIPNNSDSSTVGYAFWSDGDTGMFSPVVNSGSNNGVVAFYGNNVETMRILPTLSVGIGTTNPAASLEVKRSVADSNYAAWIEGTNSGNFGLGVNIANTTTTKAIADFRSANVSRLHVRADGNVGIGTITPSATLNVVGTTHLSRDNASTCCSAAGDFTLSLAENTNSTGKMSTIQFHNSGVAEGYLRLTGSGTRRFQMGDSQGVTMGLQMSGNLQVDGTGNSYVAGNVGIGTSAPGYKLDVNGTANVTGFRMPTGAGAGKVLTSDAGGLATWATPSSWTAHSTRVVTATCMETGWGNCASYSVSCNSSTEVLTGGWCSNGSTVSVTNTTYTCYVPNQWTSGTAYAVCLAK